MSFKRRALLIGIQYTDTEHELSDAHLYVRKFRQHLITKLKWPDANIRCLLDQTQIKSSRQPTKANINNELTRILVKAKLEDLTIIYYCGHGSKLSGTEDEVLLPSDYKVSGGITGRSMRAIIEHKLLPNSKCWLIIDSASTGFRGGLGLKVIPRHISLKQDLLIIDRQGQAINPVGILEIINEHDHQIKGHVIILTSFQSENEVIVYGLLTDYWIRRLSESTNITFAALLARLGRDLLQPAITSQQPLLALSVNSRHILNHRVYNYI